MDLSKLNSNGRRVFKNLRVNKSKRYPDRNSDRFQNGMFYPELTPSFTLREGAKIFTIGSCFARNVEEKLLQLGFRVPCKDFSAPASEAGGRRNRLLNQYNPGSMSQFLVSALDGEDLGGMHEISQDQVMDSLLSTGKTVTRQRAEERRREIVRLYQDGLMDADAVFITLGLTETWIDLRDQVFLNDAPPLSLLKADPDRFAYVPLRPHRSSQMVRGMIERLRRESEVKIIITVSPVPLQTTFSVQDAVIANSYSKAVLRVAATTVANEFDGVDYFPSFEMVSTMGFDALVDDNVHVRGDIVGKVVNYMTDAYVEKGDAATVR